MNSIIKQQYFSLLKKLNNGNKVKNEKTNMIFLLELGNEKNQMIFASIEKNQKILLVERKNDSLTLYWKPSSLTGFDELETFVANLMKDCEGSLSTTDIDNVIKSNIFKDFN